MAPDQKLQQTYEVRWRNIVFLQNYHEITDFNLFTLQLKLCTE